MGESDELIRFFPGLLYDAFFSITSPVDRQYNCIAWAFGLYTDRWMQFDTKPRFDGVWYWWPEGVAISPSVLAYIEAFKTRGFEICDSHDFETGYVKIALYVQKETEICTHASRQKTNGIWMSKLGQNHDIEHGTPFSIQGNAYGDVYCFMKAAR
jgi:hypothetical protein